MLVRLPPLLADAEARNPEENVNQEAPNLDLAKNEEIIENLSAEMSARRAFVNISQNNLVELSITAFAQRFARDNSKWEIPFPQSITRDGGAFRLGHKNQRDRDGAALAGIIIDDV